MDKNEIEQAILFQQNLFGNEPLLKMESIEGMDSIFVLQTIGSLIKFRPFLFCQIVDFLAQCCTNVIFKDYIIKNWININRALVFRLFKMGVYSIKEVQTNLMFEFSTLTYMYFKDYISDISEYFDILDFDQDLFDKYIGKDIEFLINHGFEKDSLEYVLKFDILDSLESIMIEFNFQSLMYAEWSPFEWSFPLNYLDILSFASYFGSVKCAKYLLMNSYPITSDSLNSVVCSGNFELFHMYSCVNHSFNILIHNSILFCQKDIILYFFENGFYEKSNICSLCSSLVNACSNGILFIIDTLIDLGFPVDTTFGEDSRSLIHEACFNGNLVMVKYLQIKGLSVNVKNHRNETPLHFAVQNGHDRIVEFLVSNNADVNSQNIDIRTPLHIASYFGFYSVAKLLINKGADINSKNKYNESPLYEAQLIGNAKITELLVRNGADVNAKTNENDTPLHAAIRLALNSSISILINNGAELNVRDKNMMTPLQIAIDIGETEIAQMLTNAGAII